MIDLFKDRYKVSLIMAALFLIGVMASLYQVYRLPHNLMLTEGYHPALFNVYLVLGFTFFIGAFTLWSALNYKNEVIVYRDKQIDLYNASQENVENNKSTISLDQVRESLKQAKTEKEAGIAGLTVICKQLEAGQGAVYLPAEKDGRKKFELQGGYAITVSENNTITYEAGEGLIGQAAVSGKTLYLDDVPQGYVKIISGLGSASPRFILIVVIKKHDQIFGVLEIATFTAITEDQRKFVEESGQLIADKITGQP